MGTNGSGKLRFFYGFHIKTHNCSKSKKLGDILGMPIFHIY